MHEAAPSTAKDILGLHKNQTLADALAKPSSLTHPWEGQASADSMQTQVGYRTLTLIQHELVPFAYTPADSWGAARDKYWSVISLSVYTTCVTHKVESTLRAPLASPHHSSPAADQEQLCHRCPFSAPH